MILNIFLTLGVGFLVCAVVVLILLKYDCMTDDDYDESNCNLQDNINKKR